MVRAGAACIVLLLVAVTSGAAARSDGDAACPARALAPARLPGVRAEQETLAYWLRVVGARHDLDAVLLSPEAIARRNAEAASNANMPASRQALAADPDDRLLRDHVTARLARMEHQLARGEWVGRDGQPLERTAFAPFLRAPDVGSLRPSLRVALADIPLRCAPWRQILRKPGPDEAAFDENACSTVREQEAVQVLGAWPGGMRLARTRYALGWLPDGAALSPPVTTARALDLLGGERVRADKRLVLRTTRGTAIAVAPRTTLPLAPSRSDRVLVGTAAGVEEAPRLADLRSTRRPLTRRAFLEAAWPYLGTRYGYGDAGGGLDCSRLVLDVFEAFDLEMPRNSSSQSRAGSSAIDIPAGASTAERLRLLDEADARGIVLLYLPGHIALYLGRNDDGVPMALHAFTDYRAPCAGGSGETRYWVRRVAVSRLDLGRGSARGTFLDGIVRLVVFAN